MSNVLNNLVSHKLKKVEHPHDYLQLQFETGVIVNVFNSFSVKGCVSGGVLELTGCEVDSIVSDDSKVELIFKGGKALCVGMKDDDYQGPEAIEYIDVDGKRIIWQ